MYAGIFAIFQINFPPILNGMDTIWPRPTTPSAVALAMGPPTAPFFSFKNNEKLMKTTTNNNLFLH